MGYQIVKCARDVDLYVEWSSVTESPTWVGTRDEVHAYLASDPSRSPGYADRVLATTDEYGTSAPHFGCTWTHEGERYRNGGRLPRDRMAEFARRVLDASPTASPDDLIADLLVPIDYGDRVSDSLPSGPTVVASVPFTPEMDGLDLATALLEAYRQVPEPFRGHVVWVTGMDALPRLASVSMLEASATAMAVPVRWSGTGPPVRVLGRPVIVAERYADSGRVDLWDGWPPWALR